MTGVKTKGVAIVWGVMPIRPIVNIPQDATEPVSNANPR
jgi:hypothetical protein